MHLSGHVIASIGITESERCDVQKRLSEVIQILDKSDSEVEIEYATANGTIAFWAHF